MTIGVHGAAREVAESHVLAAVREDDIGVTPARLGKNLDALINEGVVLLIVVFDLLAIKDDRRRARLLGDIFEGLFFGRMGGQSTAAKHGKVRASKINSRNVSRNASL